MTAFGTLICTMCVLRSILTIVSGQYVVIGLDEKLTPSTLLRAYLIKAHTTFFISGFESFNTTASTLDIFLTGIILTSEFLNWVHYYLITLFLSLSALTLYKASSEFSSVVLKRKKRFYLEHFHDLKLLAKHINKALGPLTSLILIGNGFYFSTDIDNIFIATNWFLKSVFIMDFLEPIIILIVAAEVGKIVSLETLLLCMEDFEM